MNDVLGTNRLNVTKTVHKYSIDRNFKCTGPEFLAGPVSKVIYHDDFVEGAYAEGIQFWWRPTLNFPNPKRFRHHCASSSSTHPSLGYGGGDFPAEVTTPATIRCVGPPNLFATTSTNFPCPFNLDTPPATQFFPYPKP
ncbi:hypothetical protein POM88_003974 [Heracleum sosnowskyi]|uniref:Uncharacterized protein n=1 Tax=Heracleum sosnowskyi TaxID=360622 RepID=A0AAD8JIY7_9APIA|nr:hypothetical protein POM88_003974 [Heracleum sosnowskyi]